MNQEQRDKINKGMLHFLAGGMLVVNGIATGQLILIIRHMITNGTDQEMTMMSLLYVLLCAYTFQRFLYAQRELKKLNDKNRQK